MPSFEENLDQQRGTAMQFQIGLQNDTISRAPNSLLNQLRKGLQGTAATPEDYLMICSLRKWQMSPVPMIDKKKPDEPAKPRPITEIGSANLNDRSMLGDRDSELAVCMDGAEDHFIIDPASNSKVGVNQQIHDFRRAIFEEHFGAGNYIKWPAATEAWQRMRQIAETNTQIYDEVFKTYPSNNYPDFTGLLNKEVLNCDEELFEQKKSQISGSAILYAYDFLKDVNLFYYGITNKIVSMTLLKVFQ